MGRRVVWRLRFGGGVVCVALLAAPLGYASGAVLRSPWDGVPVKATDAAYDCPPVAHLPVDFVTDGFYKIGDPTHSIVDPVRMKAYRESAAPEKHDGNVVVAAADAYRTTGSLAAARCAVAHMEANARGRALTGKMSSNQAYYVQGWVLGGEAIAYLKVRDSGVVSAEQSTLILRWMKDVSRQARDYYDAKKAKAPDTLNNHYYWAGVELAAVGIAANDREDFKWGMSAAEQGISSILPDGTLPNEMRRGQRALHYHLYAAGPLVTLAEFGMSNGMDLYAKDGGALKHLVRVAMAGLVDPAPFAKATGITQLVGTPSSESIEWAVPFNRRFPDPVIAKLLGESESKGNMYLGGLPPA